MIVMDLLIDLVTGEDIIKDGDNVIGDATGQNQELILYMAKGELKESPLFGVGLFTFLDDEGPDELIRAVRIAYVQDQMNINSISFVEQGLKVDANY